MSILLENKDYLLKDYDIGKIIDREDEIKKINDWLNFRSGTLYIFGSSGTGKTYVTKKIILSNPNLTSLYLNCKDVKNEYQVFKKCFLFLKSKNFIFGEIDEKAPLYLILDIIKKTIEKFELNFVLILDEINRLDLKDINSLIYQSFEFCPRKGSFGLVAISNDIFLDSKFSEPVISRIGLNKIHFPPYNVPQIYEILKEYANLCLKENSYNNDVIFRLAKYVYDAGSDLRTAKSLMFYIAKHSENFFDLNYLETALFETKKDLLNFEIQSLSEHQKLVLLAVIEVAEGYENFKIHAKGLKMYDPTKEPKLKNIYKKYLSLCEKYQTKEKSENIFREILKDLEKRKLIMKDVRGLGRGKGVSGFYYPILPDVVKPLILNSLY